MTDSNGLGSRNVDLSKLDLENLYAAAYVANFTNANQAALGLTMPVNVFLQDPYVAEQIPELGLNEIVVGWEPGLDDGPTSAKLAVVDYNGDTGALVPPVNWSEKQRCFVDEHGRPISGEDAGDFGFHQVNVWAIIQRIIAYFESPWSLGRPLPWGFEGNRLLVVPHAGYGENAFYDRHSKSLQFYYYGTADDPKYTCLSHDIIAHETGHAILDGIRPYYLEDTSTQTGAFHEFMGDLTAILTALDINQARHLVGDLADEIVSDRSFLNRIGEEFGKYVTDRPYLRNAHERKKMSDFQPNDGPHAWSQVLTSAMYHIFVLMLKAYLKPELPGLESYSQKQALAYATRRIQTTALHALDFLPPVDVQFADYARAVLRAFDFDDPTDKRGLRKPIVNTFVEQGILDAVDEDALQATKYPYVPIQIRANMTNLSRSRAAAYRFLNDNRRGLRIPAQQDIIVADLYDNNKLDRSFLSLPRQIVLEYVWQEAVLLDGSEFGPLAGRYASLLCGGTLVFDGRGNVLSWQRKHGTEFNYDSRQKDEKQEGEQRRKDYLDHIKRRVQNGMLGWAGEELQVAGAGGPPVTVHDQASLVRFELTPHLSLGDNDQFKELGGRTWRKSF